MLPLPTAASAKQWGEPPPYDLGFKAFPCICKCKSLCHCVRIAFACAGHDLAGSCELRLYNVVLPLPTAASAKHWGGTVPIRFKV